MSFLSKKNVKNLLKKYRIRPSKRLGQNFLIDKGVMRKIIRATEIEPKDIVLEIGPGLGVLTQELARKAKRVIGVEKDKKMVAILKETLKDFNNVEIIQRDILKLRATSYKLQDYKVVGNLPFYLTAPVIRKFLEAKNPPREMVLVVQKEVGQRICPPRRARSSGEAGAHPPKMSILAVSVQFYAKPEIISYVSKKSLWPQPKVDAAIIKITPFRTRTVLVPLFFKIVKAGFSQSRKQLINNLSRKLKLNRVKVENWLRDNNIRPTQRAETLSIEDWKNLTKTFKIS